MKRLVRDNSSTAVALLCSGFLAISLLVLAQAAVATTFEYEITGNVNAPILNNLTGNPVNLGGGGDDDDDGGANFQFTPEFELFIDQGSLRATYDDMNTPDNTADDVFRIFGSTPGCVGGCGNTPFVFKDGDDDDDGGAQDVQFAGQGEFQWDIAVGDPLGDQTTGPENFTFGEQDAGTLQLVNPPDRVFGDTADLMAKNDKNFALKFFLDPNANDGSLIGEGWIVINNAFLGNDFSRLEFGPNNAQLNWDLRLRPVGPPPPPAPPAPAPPPPGVIPEPGTVGLLLMGLLAGAGIKYRRRA